MGSWRISHFLTKSVSTLCCWQPPCNSLTTDHLILEAWIALHMPHFAAAWILSIMDIVGMILNHINVMAAIQKLSGTLLKHDLLCTSGDNLFSKIRPPLVAWSALQGGSVTYTTLQARCSHGCWCGQAQCSLYAILAFLVYHGNLPWQNIWTRV